ncbi:MAG: geranylgeranylglyceryl/heptaprenylglyceryl phosphate synthase [Bacteroidetes bacterium]|nr:geranylgeranylglyceryl/heptaprenylglyceryl phosphate synthase [Bacteroidota bacterium]
MSIYLKIREQGPAKKFAVLIDPDKYSGESIIAIAKESERNLVDILLVGGSLLINDHLEETILRIKDHCSIPVVLFPGSSLQVNRHADAILFLSLISGRNPEMLIGQHVIAAPYIRDAGLEVIPTGYMLIESGETTTASYMSNSLPIPYHKKDIAVCTAMAGEMLGLKMIYLDGGSGAMKAVSVEMVESVRQNISIPMVVGGGIRDPQTAADICKAGADLVVVGNAIEDNMDKLSLISDAIHSL